MSYRVNLDGTPHTCQFDEDGTCQLHVFTKLIEKPSANPKVEWHDGWIFVDNEIYIAQRFHSAKCAEIERLRELLTKAGDLLTYADPCMELQSDDGSDWIDKCDEWFKA